MAQPDEPETPQEVSLEELSQAFAQVMGGGPATAEPPELAEELSAGEEPAEGAAPSEDFHAGLVESFAPAATGLPGEADADPCEISPRTILEAMLFVGMPGEDSLTAARAAELMRGVESGEIADLVDDLNRRYAEAGRPYQVISEGAGYRLALRPEFHGLRAKFYGRTREARLSQAAVDVLAIVAYRQPITAEEVNKLRETPSGAMLSQLVRRQLLRLERTDEKPRKTLYYTTDRFLELFGLEDLADLPQTEDLG